jgi:ABC-type transport system involved in multi-copper enzyme maturation permease subunit
MTAEPGTLRRFAQASRMEWIKLRSLRSTWWTLAATVAGAAGIAVAVGVNTKRASGDVTNNVLGGVAPGLLLIGVLGVLTMTGEYSSGTIRATLAAVPGRSMLLAAKAAVFGGVTLAVGEATAFLAFTAGRAALPGRVPPPALGDPGVLRAVLLSGVGVALVGLFGLGVGAVFRHSAAALAVYAGVVFVVGEILFALVPSVVRYIPLAIVGDSLAVSRPGADALSPWTGLAVLCLYAAVTLVAGGGLLARRDA